MSDTKISDKGGDEPKPAEEIAATAPEPEEKVEEKPDAADQEERHHEMSHIHGSTKPSTPKKCNLDFFICIGMLILFGALCFAGAFVVITVALGGEKGEFLRSKMASGYHGAWRSDGENPDMVAVTGGGSADAGNATTGAPEPVVPSSTP